MSDMKNETGAPPGFWKTVRLLLRASRKRADGRRKRQRELLNNRAKKSATDWSALGVIFSVLFMALVNVFAAIAVLRAVTAAERAEAEFQGKIVVSGGFLRAVNRVCKVYPVWTCSQFDPPPYSSEAKEIAEEYGGSKEAIEKKLRDAVSSHGAGDFVTSDQVAPGIEGLPKAGRLASLAGSIFLVLWGVMLVFQGEGLELDIQRRRHPMWEWLYSHPIPTGAIFLAEMLSPIAANPLYWSGPLFAGVLYGSVYGVLLGLVAAVLVGVPVTVAAACLGKALEIGVILRFSPRTRGGMIGLMSWMGYASMMLFLVGFVLIPKVVSATAKILQVFTAVPWPWLRLFLGLRPDGGFSFVSGVCTCWAFASIVIAGAVGFSVWGAKQGLSGNFAAVDSGPSKYRKGGPRFGREPLYRKEFLWFIRDRSAIVQTILIPLTVAGYQVFNLRGLLSRAQGNWNYLCGTAIIFGTYFLWVLGPKSLSSEGAALWISLTWPRGLESLLKAKAWLWTVISTGLVSLVLCYAAFVFPHEIWKIGLAGVAWWFFGRSMAEKSVTLVTVTSESGEVQKIPSGRRWATSLGMLTFAIGILTQQWHIAVMGIVYSYITAAAMWQNFRARLPYLYDPWSEEIPPSPTLMHAMIAISILVEGGAVMTGLLMFAVGRDNIAIAQAFSYGICAVAVSISMSNFLSNRGVMPRDVWCILPEATKPDGAEEEESARPFWVRYGLLDSKLYFSMLMGAAGGLALGLLAHGYLAILDHIPAVAEILRKSKEQMDSIPNLRISYAVMAVGFAPFAEEYLFRGLLFRALDREWGGWKAVVGSAAFFAIYHGPIAWLPVGLLGVANALLFKKTGRLAPAVLLHMVYNTVVVSW
jgi:membrane protease YdiL (CAAX protease family)